MTVNVAGTLKTEKGRKREKKEKAKQTEKAKSKLDYALEKGC